MKNKQELKLFIDDFLGEQPPAFFISELRGVFNIDFVNCVNWSARYHHLNLDKIKQLDQSLNKLGITFNIKKIA